MVMFLAKVTLLVLNVLVVKNVHQRNSVKLLNAKLVGILQKVIPNVKNVIKEKLALLRIRNLSNVCQVPLWKIKNPPYRLATSAPKIINVLILVRKRKKNALRMNSHLLALPNASIVLKEDLALLIDQVSSRIVLQANSTMRKNMNVRTVAKRDNASIQCKANVISVSSELKAIMLKLISAKNAHTTRFVHKSRTL